jgi:hypothetical protein
MNESDPSRKWWKRTVNPRVSGIFALRTGYLRISQAVRRPGKRFRPPLTASLVILLCGIVLGAAATVHRRHLDVRFGASVVASATAPFEIQRVRRDLAGLALDEESLQRELEARLAVVDAQESAAFYLVLDTKANRLSFRYGDRLVRDAPLTVGPPRPIRSASGEKLSPAPLSGAFTVRQKLERPAWKPPAWIWEKAGVAVPRPLPEIRGGLGRYVLVLADDVVLHSPPPRESPLKGAKPGSFLAPEADLAAIWKRVGTETRIYVF